MTSSSTPTPNPVITDMEKETENLKKQLDLLKAQNELATEQSKSSLSGITAIKTALSGLNLPQGKEGTIKIAAGTDGTALLRAKKQMIELLNQCAGELAQEITCNAVLVTETQLDKAYKAELLDEMIGESVVNFSAFLDKVTAPKSPTIMTKGLAAVLPIAAEAISGIGALINTAANISKLFRVDREINIFASDAEASLLLGYLLEKQNNNIIANPEIMRDEALLNAAKFMKQLNSLYAAHKKGESLASLIEGKLNTVKDWTPAHDNLAVLKTHVEIAKIILDNFHPAKKEDAFWEHIKGCQLYNSIKGRARVIVQVKAQALQITEKSFWIGERIKTTGELQVAYRITDTKGNVTKAGVLLKASQAERGQFNKLPVVKYP